MKIMVKHKEAMAKYYNRKVKVKRFNTRDHVLKKILQAQRTHPKENWDQPGKHPTK